MNLNLISRKIISIENDPVPTFEEMEIINTDSESNPVYSCISYAWGDEFIPHPYDKSINISKRTLPVITTAMYAYQSLQNSNEKDLPVVDKFWIDSLCMPRVGKERDQHIFLLGEIYNKSSIVIVVLSKEFSKVLEKVTLRIPFNEEDFEIINNDHWVSRYWTYQEIVKSGKVYLVSESIGALVVHASEFFEKLTQEFDVFCHFQNIKTIESIKKYPCISALEAVILDQRIQEFRSIYQVMVNMEYRKSSNDDNKLTAINSFLATSENLDVLHFENEFTKLYELCKRNNDYSFIFNTSTHRESNNRKWKPTLYDFKPIYSWLYGWGEKQYGEIYPDYLLLKDFILETKSVVSTEAVTFLTKILKDNVTAESADVLDLIRANLSGLNFEGCLDPVELDRGFYFDQFNNNFNASNIIAICSGVQWTFGAPAMKLEKRESSDIYDFISAGVFFGKIRDKNITHTTIKID